MEKSVEVGPGWPWISRQGLFGRDVSLRTRLSDCQESLRFRWDLSIDQANATNRFTPVYVSRLRDHRGPDSRCIIATYLAAEPGRRDASAVLDQTLSCPGIFPVIEICRWLAAFPRARDTPELIGRKIDEFMAVPTGCLSLFPNVYPLCVFELQSSSPVRLLIVQVSPCYGAKVAGLVYEPLHWGEIFMGLFNPPWQVTPELYFRISCCYCIAI